MVNYFAVAGGGYATYGSNVTGDLLLSYPRAAFIARVALAFVVVLSHPCVSHPALPAVRSTINVCFGPHKPKAPRVSTAGRAALERRSPASNDGAAAAAAKSVGVPPDARVAMERAVPPANASPPSSPLSPPPSPPSSPRLTPPSPSAPSASGSARRRDSRESTFVNERSPVTIILVYLTVTTGIALLVTDLGIVVSLAGAVAATMAVFVAPGACYWSLHRESRSPRSPKMVAAAVLACTGLALMPCLVLLVLASHGYFGVEWSLEG